MSRAGDLRERVAQVARTVAAAGLVQGFGHVSARLPGLGFVITSTAPVGAQTADDVRRPETGDGVPLEAALHAALYAARPDVGGIVRTHSRYAVAWGSRGEVPPLVHGLGGLAGQIALHDAVALVTDSEAGARAARALGDADCLLLRGNGALAAGADPEAAAVRAWFLEERARVAHDAGPTARPLSARELTARERYFPEETARAWRWLSWRFSGAGDRIVPDGGGAPCP